MSESDPVIIVDKPETPGPRWSIRTFISETPTKEFFPFGIFLFAQFLQWTSLQDMCETAGRYGTSNFITDMMLSAVVAVSLDRLKKVHAITFALSAVAMSLYFSAFGW